MAFINIQFKYIEHNLPSQKWIMIQMIKLMFLEPPIQTNLMFNGCHGTSEKLLNHKLPVNY